MSRQVCGNCLCPYGDDGQCACVEDQVMTTERDCKHGQLARSCNVCELESEVARQAAEIERLKSTPPDQREDLRCVIADLMRQCQESEALLLQALVLLRGPAPNGYGVGSEQEAVIAAIKTHLGEQP